MSDKRLHPYTKIRHTEIWPTTCLLKIISNAETYSTTNATFRRLNYFVFPKYIFHIFIPYKKFQNIYTVKRVCIIFELGILYTIQLFFLARKIRINRINWPAQTWRSRPNLGKNIYIVSTRAFRARIRLISFSFVGRIRHFVRTVMSRVYLINDAYTIMHRFYPIWHFLCPVSDSCSRANTA